MWTALPTSHSLSTHKVGPLTQEDQVWLEAEYVAGLGAQRVMLGGDMLGGAEQSQYLGESKSTTQVEGRSLE